MAKFAPAKAIKPEEIEVGGSIEVHAQALATFKTYVSRANSKKTQKIRFDYGQFIGNFCKATRIS